MTISCCLCLRLLPLDIHLIVTAVRVWVRYQCLFKFRSCSVLVGYTFGLVKVKLIKMIFVLEYLTLLHLWIMPVRDIYIVTIDSISKWFSFVNNSSLKMVWLLHVILHFWHKHCPFESCLIITYTRTNSISAICTYQGIDGDFQRTSAVRSWLVFLFYRCKYVLRAFVEGNIISFQACLYTKPELTDVLFWHEPLSNHPEHPSNPLHMQTPLMFSVC